MHAFIIWLNATSEVVLATAWPMFLQSSLLIVCLFALDLLLKKKVKAVVRYLFWMLILVKLILPPTLSSPISIGHWSGEFVSPEIVMVSPTPFQSQVPMPANQALTPTMTNPEESLSVPYLTWQAMILVTWVLGVSAMAIFLIQRAFFVRALLAHSGNVPQELIDLLSQCRTTLQMSRSVRLRQTSLSTSPSVCGLARPTILLPDHIIESFDFQDLKSILLHELAHVKRGDLWVNLCQTLLQVFYFFNPLLWIANAHIRKIREQAVDETVLAAMGHEAEAYPKTLITISRHVWGRPVLSLRLLGVAESPKALLKRIIHITSKPFPKTVRIGLVSLASILLIGALLLPMAQASNQMPFGQAIPILRHATRAIITRPPLKKAPMDPNVLAQFPEQIGDWIGQDVPLDEAIILGTDTDAHLNRRYVRGNGADTVSFFVACGVQARDLMPHRPEVYYVGNGWTLTDKRFLELPLKDGTKLPCNVMQFSRGGLVTKRHMVLHYYLVDGEYCHDLGLLRSKAWRGSGTVDYVSQVQIMTPVTEALGSDSSATKRVSDFAVASAAPLAALFAKPEPPIDSGESEGQ